MVFQSFNLFSNMNVLSNCMVGMRRVLKIDNETAKQKALFYLNKVGMSPYINARPRQLSGGKAARSHCQALAMEPEILLFDDRPRH
jgi:putative lysine transport system ATP-binding protein